MVTILTGSDEPGYCHRRQASRMRQSNLYIRVLYIMEQELRVQGSGLAGYQLKFPMVPNLATCVSNDHGPVGTSR